MVHLTSTVTRKSNVETHPMGHDVILVRSPDKAPFGLNQVGYRIWQCLEKPSSIAAIINLLLQEFNVSREDCEQQVLVLMGQLLDQQLVQIIE